MSEWNRIHFDWISINLKDHFKIKHGYAFSGEYFFDNPPGEILLVPGNFHRNGGLYFDENNTKYYNGPIHPGTILNNYDLVIVMTDLSPKTLILGRVAEINHSFKLLHNQRVGLFEIKKSDEWNKKYLLYALNIERLRNEIIVTATGTTVRHTSPAKILSNSILKPPLPEQRKIAAILTTVDNLIEKTEALIAKYEKIKQGMMQDLFTRGVDQNGHLRPPQSEAPHLYKKSALGWIPNDWEVKKLNSIIKIIDCKHYTPIYVEEGIPIIRPRNIKDDGFDLSDLDFVTKKDYLLLTDKHIPSYGDIVFSRNASFGIPVYVQTMRPFCIGQDVVVMVKTSINSHFIFYALKSNNVVEQILNVSGGSTFGRIDLGAIRDLKIAFPIENEEQILIKQRLYNCECFILSLKNELLKTKSIKTALMQDLLTGKVRVKVDEVEEALAAS